jgi:hypothetical protein
MYYLLFALTTAITAQILLFIPALKVLKKEQPLNIVTAKPMISLMIFSIISTILAPILIIVLIIPVSTDRFKETLITSLRS